MTGAALSLDHVGAMVEDLDAGAARWRRLGFRLAPESRQAGVTRPGGPVEVWATANRCAVLGRGYLELIGVVDATRFNPWRGYMDRFEGIHIAAFRCADADDAYGELSRRAEGFDPPVDRKREAPFGDGTKTMKFRNIFSRDEFHPEGRFIVIEHQTPEVLWQAELATHPNGALRLETVILFADDPGPVIGRMEAIAGAGADRGRIDLALGGAVEVLDREGIEARFPGLRPPLLPCMGGCAISVADLAAARRLIAANGVPLNESGGGKFWIAPQFANGAAMEFIQG